MARGASFDVDLERRIGEAMGIEIRALGRTMTGAVCVNLLRHPAWGRAQETYGEDPHHLGEMGAALSQGIQSHNVVASVKHLAVNSMENARFKVDVRVDERTLREVYLPHFKRIIDSGCASVMSAYNRMNGEYCGQNRYLLTDILRGEWGFTGFVHSDWVRGVYKVYGASAGLDVENPEPLVFGKSLVDAVENGHVEPQVIDQACRRILETQFRMTCAEDPLAAYTPDLVACPAHRELAYEAACKGAVLLKNDGGFFPLSQSGTTAIVALRDLNDTCRQLARSLTAAGSAATCTVPNLNLSGGTRPFGALTATAPKATKKVAVVATLPTTGSYLVQLQTLGNTTLSIGGNIALQVAGTTEFPCPSYTTVTGTAHQAVPMSV
ncbi:MAG: glycoside hydrolase family 3 protein, partial [Caulobacteraceae bacterium]|nr:glycoside hydrolase family 3 protein [Caulobacteraceae bacterium]